MIYIPLDSLIPLIPSSDIEFVQYIYLDTTNLKQYPIRGPLYVLVTFNYSSDSLNIYIIDTSILKVITCLECSYVSEECELYKGYQFIKYATNVLLTNHSGDLTLLFISYVGTDTCSVVGCVLISNKLQQDLLIPYIYIPSLYGK